ncbi:MAG: hypothetical protein U1F43_02235 [Myxococcota bacterium]
MRDSAHIAPPRSRLSYSISAPHPAAATTRRRCPCGARPASALQDVTGPPGPRGERASGAGHDRVRSGQEVTAMVAARRAGRLGQCAKTICHSLAALARVDAVVAVVGLGGVVGVVGLAACPGGEPAVHDTLPGDGGDAWQTLASGAWSAAEAPLGTSLAPAVAGVGRPGDLLAPESLAVTAGGVLVLDPARARIVRIAADGKGDIARSDPRLADATDLAAATDGALWVARGGGVARIAADGGWLDVALAPELVGSMLVATADGLVVGDPGAARRSPVVAGGQALDLDAQRATAPADAALGWSVELALDGLARATLRAPDGAGARHRPARRAARGRALRRAHGLRLERAGAGREGAARRRRGARGAARRARRPGAGDARRARAGGLPCPVPRLRPRARRRAGRAPPRARRLDARHLGGGL